MRCNLVFLYHIPVEEDPVAGFPRLVESHGIFIGKFPGPGKSCQNELGPGKSWKSICMALESPGIC